jgi:D-beta-D-heptose 7-phosphate kinase/D-beta-D-heptose 1-phosphate adenosyltransferase
MVEFKKSRIMVIGDAMIDHYVYGTVERISPEAPVPVLNKEEEKKFLGGAGVVASNLKNLGADVDFISVVGEDGEADTIRQLLSEKQISDEHFVIERGRHTILKKRFIATSPYFQMLMRMDKESKERIKLETEQEIIKRIRDGIDNIDFIIISDYNKGLLSGNIIDSVLTIAKEKDKKIIVDTKQSLYHYKGVYLIVPNLIELCITSGLKTTNSDEIITPEAVKLSKSLNAKLIVKRGGKGATIADDLGIRSYPSLAKDIVNVSGAGDIFVAILTMALDSGEDIDEAVKLANLGCAKAIARKHPTVRLEDFK